MHSKLDWENGIRITISKEKTDELFACTKCNRICRTKVGLTSHQKSCLKLGDTDSFLKYHHRKTYDKNDKILPPSLSQQSVSNVDENAAYDHRELETNQDNILRSSGITANLPDFNPVKLHPSRNQNNLSDTKFADYTCKAYNEPAIASAISADEGNNNCNMCRMDVLENENSVICELCNTMVHQECIHMTDEEYLLVNNNEHVEWICARCRLIKSNKIKWGKYCGEENIRNIAQSTYDTIVGWKRNIFSLPRGNCGVEFIKELTRLINLFANKTQWQRISLSMLHIFIPIMLQKPSAKSKPRDHAKYLKSRLDRWHKGELDSLMKETCEIQRRMMRTGEKRKEESKYKSFVQMMMFGRIGDAAKKVNNEDSVKGVHQLNDQIKEILEQKHPKARLVQPHTILPQTSESPQPVIYEEITSDYVYKIAKQMKGSGGPSLIDSESWKHFLCSKVYGKASTDLCQAVADLAKLMCTEKIHPDCLTEYVACRMIPLDKGNTKDNTPGVRPVGVGEVLRRIVGKLLIGVIKNDITKAAGPLQTCTGIEAGIEASIHAMRQVFEKEETEAILMVDAENAFNNLNRKAALKNIKEICPPFYQYLDNTYQKPAKLIISGKDNYEIIYSEEGTTQGDVTAMGMYGLGIKPLIDELAEEVDINLCKQVWYADDSSSAGHLEELKRWWDKLYQAGPRYGYFPLPSKTVLIVKPQHYQRASDIFSNTGVTISLEGERHMGAVIGSTAFKESYINKKVTKWVEDIEELTKIATDEPQAAYSCYTKAICHRWSYVQRTVPNIEHLFEPLEFVIREKLIPALVGRKVSDIERRIFALPVRLGGLGISDPTKTSSFEHAASLAITENLTEIIVNQEKDFVKYNKEKVKEQIAASTALKQNRYEEELNCIMGIVDVKLKRILELNQESGTGVWLTATPKQALGYTLNKQEFRDSICLRYGWSIPNTPTYCECSKQNDIDHTLSCSKGGYIIMRHNKIRDLEAELMKEVCHNVQIEPALIPVEEDNLFELEEDRKRPDVSGVGIWGPYEKTFLDIMITHPNCPSYANKPIEQIYANQERIKKRKYNERIIHVEKGTFTPIIGSTFGGWGAEANRHHKRIATLIAEKKNESYADVINYIRTRLRFSMLKSILMAIRGVRGTTKHAAPISSISFNLIDS